jgi:flagellin
MTSSDAVLGGINATNAKTATSASGSLVEGTTAFVAGNGTVMTAGSTTTISDATTGEQLTFVAKAGDTLANLNAAIGAAVTAGTLSAGTTATINAATGQLSIGTNSSTLGIAVETNDPALGAMTAVPGSAVANAYAYVGNSGVNSVQVGDSTDVPTNVAGNQLLTSGANVIGSLNKLITALQSGSLAQVGDATNGISAALSYVSQQRVPLDNTITRLNSQESYLSQETLNLTTQQTALVGIPLADAATNFSQAQLDNSAVLGAAAKALPQTLLQYLQ